MWSSSTNEHGHDHVCKSIEIMTRFLLAILWFSAASLNMQCTTAEQPAQEPENRPVTEEVDGFVLIEAENFDLQEADSIRRWYKVTTDLTPAVGLDGDENHAASASEGSYIEILPDTRRNHDEELIHGENFSNKPGVLAILHYPIQFNTPGRYYVWVRAHSTGTEDNGVHVGLNGEWPESGQRMQWCEGKNAWRWESKQRTEAEHCGEPFKIYLDIPSSGIHTVSFSMREDGFEMDQLLLTMDRQFTPLVTRPLRNE